MRYYLFLFCLLLELCSKAQHCPWDCSGLILMKTNLSAAEFRQLAPVLVDQQHQLVVDTVYGTGLETWDTCAFMAYADFQRYRVSRVALHHWYANDTVYQFAKGNYLVRFNYCHYRSTEMDDLFIRFNHPVTHQPVYIDVPLSKRIHLHDFRQDIFQKNPLDKSPSLQAKVFWLDRKRWGFPEQ